MPVIVDSNKNLNTVTISVRGRFDYSINIEFRAAYRAKRDSTTHYVLDLQDTDYMDSSALGMLLLLREHTGNDAARVKIVNCRSEIRKILSIANFQHLFSICRVNRAPMPTKAALTQRCRA